MERRTALELTTALIGGTIFGSEMFLAGCTVSGDRTTYWSEDDTRLLDEIAETILPESDMSPGAKAARVGEFMRTIVTDCYDDSETQIFAAGLAEVRGTSQARYSRSFMELTSEQRQELLTDFDRAARNSAENGNVHFYTMMKQLTIWGYFTSELGVTQALRYNPTPGRYDGCVEHEPGERAWF